MISLDTNVLVRILVGDDPAQTKKATRLVDRVTRAGQTAHVSEIVLCELVWVLSAGYGHGRQQIAAALRQLLAARQLTFDQTDRILRALAAYDRGKGDFADYVIREQAKAAGCDTVVTFDKVLLRDEMFASP